MKVRTSFGEGLVNFQLIDSHRDENKLKEEKERLLFAIKEYGYDSELIIKGYDNFDFFVFTAKFDEKSLYKVLQLLKEYNESLLVQDSLQ